MNCRLFALALLLLLKFTASSCDQGLDHQGFSTSKSNKTAFNKKTTINVNTKSNTTQRKISTSRSKINKKWKIDRVTIKQYGIINVLWQKTKIFLDEDYSNFTCKPTTIHMIPQTQKHVVSIHKTIKPILHGKMQPSTPSYIEFYYLDEGDDRIKRKQPIERKVQKSKNIQASKANHTKNKKSPNSHLLKIHVNTVPRKRSSLPTKLVHKVGQGNIYRTRQNKSKRTTSVSNAHITVKNKSKIINAKRPKNFRAHKAMLTTKSRKAVTQANISMRHSKSYTMEFLTGTTLAVNSLLVNSLVPASTSTVYDKVKFFEMYDNNTPKWQNFIHNNTTDIIYVNDKNGEKNRNDERILLQHVNVDTGHQQNKNKTRYVKKHIEDLYKKEGNSKNVLNTIKYVTKHASKVSSGPSKFSTVQKNFNNCSRPAIWSEYPFVAAYIYEPSKVRCDGAGISPHWLVASASCLSRHRKGLRGGGLSAFVTFCGDSWRNPQIISYVKRTLIHPLYHPKDELRQFYNAGLVQVVNSMAETCSGWIAASLMSHQFTADEKGSVGTAVGWGLDRYDESYDTPNIPRHPLMIYEGRVYSQTCPGYSEFSKAISLGEFAMRNPYCLSLPHYAAEDNDTIHGALLLIGGKLLGLYLKEERRPWGMQSAQYTSIWRLLPWLTETAREPDESFQIEI